MEEYKLSDYRKFILEINKVISCLNKLNSESNTPLYTMDSETLYIAIKHQVEEIYTRYPNLKRKVHFVDYSKFSKVNIKLTYTHKYKRISSQKKLEEYYASLSKEFPEISEISSIEDVLSGTIKAYERSVETRVYCTYEADKLSFNEQFNVGVGTVILTPSEFTTSKTNSDEKRMDRLMVSPNTIQTRFGVHFKLEEDTKSLFDMIRI